MATTQTSLFDLPLAGPAGFEHAEALISRSEEERLIAAIAGLPLRPFEFRGYLGRRRTVSFGRRYDFSDRALYAAPEPPEALLPLREAAAAFARLTPADLVHVLVTEYEPGAGIGWHRDRPEFGVVVGVSLGSACTLRFRRPRGAGWERFAFEARPRSAYRLDGPARAEWEHGIAAVAALRYSVTFRTLRPRPS